MIIFNATEKILLPLLAYRIISTPYVTGKIKARGFKINGKAAIGTNKPDKKIMGNLKKFE